MKVTVTPSACSGSVKIPPSKSMSHRAILCACLAPGVSHIDNIAYSVDVQTTIEGMRALGAEIECYEHSLKINGIKDFNHLNASVINCNESGSTLRFFIPLFAATGQRVSFTGKNRLLKRPQKIYEDLFKAQGCFYEQDEHSITIEGALKPGNYTLPGNVSSQFISGLLFILPLLEDDSRIHIENTFESKSYVLLTMQMLEEFGVQVSFEDENTLYIKGNQHYHAHDTAVEGDFSQFAFFAVMAAINHDLDILGVRHDSLQGDKQILEIIKDFGITVKEIEGGYHVCKGEPHAHDIDLHNCPDLGPIVCTLAMASQGCTKIYNAGRLRIKESDRILAMETELRKFGCDISSSEDEIIIYGGMTQTPAALSGWKDHRIVMALTVAAAIADHEVIIDEAEYIEKSYPAFFDDCRKVMIKVSEFHD